MRNFFIIAYIALLILLSSCRTSYYTVWGDGELEKNHCESKLMKTAVKYADKYGCSFYYNPFMQKDYGWAWAYVEQSGQTKIIISHKDKKGKDYSEIPYEDKSEWLNMYNPGVSHIAFWNYNTYLDGPHFYVFLKKDGIILKYIINSSITSILEKPGLDTFYDRLARDLKEYQPVPFDIISRY